MHGRTIGAPIALTIGNTEWPKWSEVMNAEDVPLTAMGPGSQLFSGVYENTHVHDAMVKAMRLKQR